jgi:hypothetical protein
MIDFDANPVFDSPDESAGHQQRSLRLLQAAIAGPEQPIGKVEIPSINEFRQSLAQWNATERPIAAATALFKAVLQLCSRVGGRDSDERFNSLQRTDQE